MWWKLQVLNMIKRLVTGRLSQFSTWVKTLRDEPMFLVHLFFAEVHNSNCSKMTSVVVLRWVCNAHTLNPLAENPCRFFCSLERRNFVRGGNKWMKALVLNELFWQSVLLFFRKIWSFPINTWQINPVWMDNWVTWVLHPHPITKVIIALDCFGGKIDETHNERKKFFSRKVQLACTF